VPLSSLTGTSHDDDDDDDDDMMMTSEKITRDFTQYHSGCSHTVIFTYNASAGLPPLKRCWRHVVFGLSVRASVRDHIL